MSMLKSAATVGGLTLVSRVLGFLRDQLIAFALGTSFVAEAFFVAQRFPNLFRALFAEGAFNNAFVPLFAKRVEGEGEANGEQRERTRHSRPRNESVAFRRLMPGKAENRPCRRTQG